MRELEVIGVRIEMPSNQPLILLRETEGDRYLPIWIGAVEASAIAFALQGESTPRPLTHELLQRVIEALGEQLTVVQIDDVADGVFYATLVFSSGATVSARPSDSIALALRTRTPRSRSSASFSRTSSPKTSPDPAHPTFAQVRPWSSQPTTQPWSNRRVLLEGWRHAREDAWSLLRGTLISTLSVTDTHVSRA